MINKKMNKLKKLKNQKMKMMNKEKRTRIIMEGAYKKWCYNIALRDWFKKMIMIYKISNKCKDRAQYFNLNMKI